MIKFPISEFWVGRKQFGKDLIAGVTVGIVALPLAIGFGITSGMSAQTGIASAILAGFIAAFFGGSKFQITGPSGSMTVVLIPVIATFGLSAIPTLGLMASFFLLLMSLLRLGKIINRMPWAVIEGFTVGIALVIALQQLPFALGVSKGDGARTLQITINTIHNAIAEGLNFTVIGIVALTLTIKFNIVKIVEHFKLKLYVPASFSSLAVSTVVVAIFHLDVPKIGNIPHNVFIWEGPKIEYTAALIAPAILVALLASMESLISARVADQLAHADRKYNPDKELFGQGLATMAASLFGGQPSTGALARTSVNIRSGGKTKMAAIIHAAFLLIVVLLLSPIFALIPLPAIAGVLIGTSLRILNPKGLREQLRSTWQEITTYVVTAVVTITVDLIWAIFVGIALHFVLSTTKTHIQKEID